MPIWKLKEFWTVLVDLVVSAILYFGGKYLAPSIFEDVKWVIVALQPVAALCIAYFATERVQSSVRAVVRALEKDHKL